MLSRAASQEPAAHYDPHAMTLCLQYVNWQDLLLMMAVFAAAAFAMMMMAATAPFAFAMMMMAATAPFAFTMMMMAATASFAFAMVMMAATISTIFTTTATTLTAHHVDQALNLCIGRIAKSDYTTLEMQVFP